MRLRADGWLDTAHGSGTWVALDVGERLANIPFEHSIVPRRERDGTNAHPATGGTVDLSTAKPVGLETYVQAAVAAAAADVGEAVTATDYSPFGLPTLRAAIADHLTAAALPTRPSEVLVTSGAQQAIGLVTELVVRAGDTVIVEAPSYPWARSTRSRGQARAWCSCRRARWRTRGRPSLTRCADCGRNCCT